jgi:hypothetical protein
MMWMVLLQIIRNVYRILWVDRKEVFMCAVKATHVFLEFNSLKGDIIVDIARLACICKGDYR